MAKRSREDSLSSSLDAASPSSTPASSASDQQSYTAKYEKLDDVSTTAERPAVMKCLLPPHQPLSFFCYAEYDVHYQQNHTNRCLECKKNFPTSHYLGLHIAENHDPINEARKARGDKIYACFVEGCDKICSEPRKRKMHMIDKHQFPKFYDFFIVNDGIEGRNSMLRPGHGLDSTHRRRGSAAEKAHQRQQQHHQQRRSDTASATAMDIVVEDKDASQQLQQQSSSVDAIVVKTTAPPAASAALLESKHALGKESAPATPTADGASDDLMEGITTSLSALKFVPPSVRFGRGGRRGGLGRR